MGENSLFKKTAMVAATVMTGAFMIGGVSMLVSAPASANDWNSTGAQTEAASEARPGRKCLDTRQAGGFHVVNEKTLMVRDSTGNPFLLDIGGPCRSMDDWSQFGFELYGSSEICRAHDAKLLYSKSGEAPVRCLINGIKPISRAEANALEEQDD